MKSVRTNIGQGVYTAADASRILKIPYPKAKYWFKYYAKQKLVSSFNYVYHFEVRDIVAVNFLTLIEMYVFYTLKEQGIRTSKILEAHEVMARFLRTPYPFAKEDIYVNKESLLFGNEEQLTTADRHLQTVIVQILKPFISKIQFNDEGLAKKFYPLGKNKTVVINPENQFGQPIVEGTNILTEAIFNLSVGGETNQFIAKLYGISLKNVEDAIEFAKAA